MRESGEWTDCKFVLVDSATTEAAAQRAKDIATSMRYLNVSFDAENAVVCRVMECVLESNVASANVCALTCDVNIETTRAVANALKKRRENLQQLNLRFTEISDHYQELLDAIALLPLIALSITVLSGENEAFCRSLVELILRKQQDLQALKLAVSEYVTANVCKLLCAPNLRDLDFFGDVLKASATRDLCASMDKMPRLKVLTIDLDAESVAISVAFIAASFRPIKKFESRSLTREDVAVAIPAFAKNTRLEAIDVNDRAFDLLPQLAECGWLCKVGYEDLPHFSKDLQNALDRNRKRHAACRRACATLIALRVAKRALTSFPKEIVIIICRYLLDTRNQPVWDNPAATNK